jgi:stalled ribosome rescue protein Dom34
MKKHVGVWIDHRNAVIVFTGQDTEEPQRIESGVEKHVRYSGQGSEHDGKADDQRDSQFAAHLDKYYDNVIAKIRTAESILIFGPGEAKGEFKNRLIAKRLGARIVAVETADKMTDHQIATKVSEYYKKMGVGVVT